jgi:hypothetical protein
MEIEHAIAMVRMYIGDPAETFLTNALADGLTLLYDLPQQNINPVGLNVLFTNGAATTTLIPTIVPGTQTTDNPGGVSNFSPWNSATAYSAGALVTYTDGNYYQCTQGNTDSPPAAGGNADWTSALYVYTLDSTNGILQVNTAIPLNATLVVNGQAWGMFTDTDLTSIIWDASRQHCQGQTLTERYRNANGGFITYRDVPKTIYNLPKVEENLVVTLASIDAMWILATDAATDVNVQTAEGTNIDRSARYAQLMEHVQSLRTKYEDWCGILGVGAFRMESLTLRRTSYTNNRLVPIFRGREYDDHRYPVRELPQIDSRDEDTSGVPSPIWNGLPL